MYVGWDWASETHDITLMDADGGGVDRWALRHDAAGIDAAIARLVTHGPPADLPVAIETASGLVVDQFSATPYLYVGPWTPDRPGDPGFWNATFGAVLGFDRVMNADDPLDAAAAFFRSGVGRLPT